VGQQAVLDTSETYVSSVIPESRTWNSGTGNWSDVGAWSGKTYTGANENGNVNFTNSGASTVTLDASQPVGQITFATPANTTIEASSGAVLTANTGITTTALATGTYSINGAYAFGAYNVFEINAGTVQLNGVVSGNYGMQKSGAGILELNNDNTFTGSVGIDGGTLRLNGNNAYTGATTVLFGTLIVGADAGSSGALGNATSTITVGADGDTFAVVGGGPAALLIDGDHTISRNIALASGTFQKTLGAINTTRGAEFSGTINIGASNNVKLNAASASDNVNFSGQIVGGNSALNVAINGLGAVVYSGVDKTYNSNTTVSSGKLLIESGTAYTGNGNISVTGGTLKVDGQVAGSGILSLFQATLSGSGSIERDTITNGSVSTISAGSEALTFSNLNAAAGARFVLDLTTLSTPLTVSNLLTGSTAAGGLEFTFYNTGEVYAGVEYTLISFNAASGLSASDFALMSGPDWVLDTSYGINGWNIENGLVQVKFSAVPEPSTVVQMVAGALLLVFVQRRFRRAKAA
ncbi:MAG: autotransporter-associated beta strand repeat-containing protein, partial [Chthoniobacterales bacterium]